MRPSTARCEGERNQRETGQRPVRRGKESAKRENGRNVPETQPTAPSPRSSGNRTKRDGRNARQGHGRKSYHEEPSRQRTPAIIIRRSDQTGQKEHAPGTHGRKPYHEKATHTRDHHPETGPNGRQNHAHTHDRKRKENEMRTSETGTRVDRMKYTNTTITMIMRRDSLLDLSTSQ